MHHGRVEFRRTDFLFDDIKNYGWPSIALHWLVAIGYLGLFALGAYMVTLGYYDALYVTLPYWHKGLGVLLMAVVLVRICWRVFNVRPQPVAGHKDYERLAARAAHWSLNLGCVVVLLSGYFISTAAGEGIDVFSWFTLPASPMNIANQEDIAGEIHMYVAYLVLAIAAAHAMAALKHHFFDRDQTLRRMIHPTRSSDE